MDLGFRDFSLDYAETALFKNFTWSIPANRWTCLLGQSGMGKSTLLRLLAGLDCKDTRIQGQVFAPTDLAYLGQNDALLPWLTVYENAILSARLGPYSKTEKNRIKARAGDLLKQTGLEQAASLYPRQLSGGMRQRVALVRALVENKSCILMDEPFSRLDAITRRQLQDLAAELLHHKTVVLVTHDPQEALRLAERIDLLSGRPATVETLIRFPESGPRDLDQAIHSDLERKIFNSLSGQQEPQLAVVNA